jgi:hypothetical protein
MWGTLANTQDSLQYGCVDSFVIFLSLSLPLFLLSMQNGTKERTANRKTTEGDDHSYLGAVFTEHELRRCACVCVAISLVRKPSLFPLFFSMLCALTRHLFWIIPPFSSFFVSSATQN